MALNLFNFLSTEVAHIIAIYFTLAKQGVLMYCIEKSKEDVLKKRAILLLSALMVSGCVSMRVPVVGNHYQVKSPASRQAYLASIRAWQTRGALSVQYDHKADIANYTWRQFANRSYQISISSSLNLYTLQLTGDRQGVVLRQNNGKLLRAHTPEVLLQRAVGWYLPITPLRYWYKGMPAPVSFGKYKATYDRYGHLSVLSQAGWKIRFDAYKQVGQVDLPQSTKIDRPGLAIKIITRRWVLS